MLKIIFKKSARTHDDGKPDAEGLLEKAEALLESGRGLTRDEERGRPEETELLKATEETLKVFARTATGRE